MDITISLKDAGLILIGFGILVLICYCIAFMKNLTVTVKQTNKILADTQVITGIAASKSQQIDQIVNDVAGSVGDISKIMKGNQSAVAALTSIVNALGSLKNLIKN